MRLEIKCLKDKENSIDELTDFFKQVKVFIDKLAIKKGMITSHRVEKRDIEITHKFRLTKNQTGGIENGKPKKCVRG